MEEWTPDRFAQNLTHLNFDDKISLARAAIAREDRGGIRYAGTGP